MVDAGLLTLAVAAALAGMGWLALAMEVHWGQVFGVSRTPSPGHVRALRLLGTLGVVASLVLCIAVDHPTMAVLVWFMALAVAAVSVAMLLSWRPQWLAVLAPWQRR